MISDPPSYLGIPSQRDRVFVTSLTSRSSDALVQLQVWSDSERNVKNVGECGKYYFLRIAFKH